MHANAWGVLNFSDSITPPDKREMDEKGEAVVEISTDFFDFVASFQQPEKIHIPRVPPHMRGTDNVFDPTAVSVGPHHREEKGLDYMQGIKREYLHKLVFREDPRDHAGAMAEFWRYLERVQRREVEARKYYLSIDVPPSAEFVRMMVLDGCFILSLFINYRIQSTSHSTARFPTRIVRKDLLLLENQIPYFILEELFQLIKVPEFDNDGETKEGLLLYLAVYYFMEGKVNRKICRDISRTRADRPVHLLDLFHLYQSELPRGAKGTMWQLKYLKRKLRLAFSRCLLFPFACLFSFFGEKDAASHQSRNIPCATDLREVGVSFQKKKGARSYTDVTFQDGTLEIPKFWIEVATKPLLPNLIAFEQSEDVGGLFSGYAWLMDNLISTTEDVAILRQESIIQYNLGSDEQVATYFNELCQSQNLDFEHHCFDNIFKEINKYAEDPRNRWRAWFKSTYFSNPWVLIALVAAILVFAMTVVQTIYTVKT